MGHGELPATCEALKRTRGKRPTLPLRLKGLLADLSAEPPDRTADPPATTLPFSCLFRTTTRGNSRRLAVSGELVDPVGVLPEEPPFQQVTRKSWPNLTTFHHICVGKLVVRERVLASGLVACILGVGSQRAAVNGLRHPGEL